MAGALVFRLVSERAIVEIVVMNVENLTALANASDVIQIQAARAGNDWDYAGRD